MTRMNTNDDGTQAGFTLHERLLIARVTGRHSELTKQEFADLIGISRTTVTSHETGKTTPKMPVLRSWAEATGYSLEWLHAGAATAEGSHPELAGIVMSTDPIRVAHPDDIPIRT